jgi:hypothetical protein
MKPKIDVVICAGPKDYNKVKYTISQAKKHIKDNIEKFYVISPDKIDDLINLKNVENHLDDDVLKINRSKIKHRPHWISQQFIKMLQQVSKSDYYVILDSDAILVNDISFFEGNKKILYKARNQNHSPYFRFSQKLMGFGREYPHSLMCEVLLYDRKVCKHILERFDGDPNKFIDKSIEIITSNCYPADHEFHANYSWKHFRDEYVIRNINQKHHEKHNDGVWTDTEIQNMINKFTGKNIDMFTIHTYSNTRR